MTRAHLQISGLVQGVCYRASCREQATRLGLTGEVRNLPDGDVAAVVEGPRAQVEQLIAWCREGPPGARVAAVQVRWSEPSGEFRTFRVAH
jgi:acylphosphatase